MKKLSAGQRIVPIIPIATSDETPKNLPTTSAKTTERTTDRTIITDHFKYFISQYSKYVWDFKISRFQDFKRLKRLKITWPY
jgi:hypothetical protein